MKQKHTDKHK